MAKLLPADRWKTHILEQIKALRLSDELRGLRARGLASLGRTKMYSFQEWWDDFGRRANITHILEMAPGMQCLGRKI